MKKKCIKCGKVKSVKDFTKKKSNSDGYNTRCRLCTRKRTKDHYDQNRQYYIDKKKRMQQVASNYIKAIKKVVFCIKCGESHPACLEFHHRNPEEKDVTIADIKKKCWSTKRISQELKKCDVLCSNCHKKEHWK